MEIRHQSSKAGTKPQGKSRVSGCLVLIFPTNTSFLPAFRIRKKNLKHDSSGMSEDLLRANVLKAEEHKIKSIVLLFSLLQELGQKRSCTMRYQLTPVRMAII